MRTIPALALALPFLLTVMVQAQEGSATSGTTKISKDGRMPVFGRVLDDHDLPVAKAEIHLVSNLLRGVPELGSNDVIRLESDARGRFRARLLPGRDYSAWAWASRKDGSRWSSQVEEDVRPGPALDLRLIQSKTTPALHLSAGKEGARYGKVMYQLGGKHFLLHELAGVEMGKPVLPRLAGDRTVLRLFDDKGHLLQEMRIALATWKSDTPIKLVGRSPRQVQIRIMDGKMAVPGVQVRLSMSSLTAELAITDKDGKATFPLEGYTNTRTKKFRSTREFLLVKAGYPATLVRYEGLPGKEKELPSLVVQLTKSRRLEGRLLDAEGQARAGMPLVLFVLSERDRKGRRSTSTLQFPLVSHTDMEGRFASGGMSLKSGHRLLALPKDGSPPILLSSSTRPPSSDLLLGDLRPGDFVRLDLAVKNDAGRPIRDASLILGEPEAERKDKGVLTRPFWIFLDKRGRAQLLMRKGVRPGFAAAWQGGITELTPNMDNVGHGPITVNLRLPRLIRLSGRIVHPDLEAYRGAALRTYFRKRAPGKLRVTNSLMSIKPRPVRSDGSFEVYVTPGDIAMLQVSFDDPTDDEARVYYGSTKYAEYENDTTDIRLDLKDRKNSIRRGGFQINLGGGK